MSFSRLCTAALAVICVAAPAFARDECESGNNYPPSLVKSFRDGCIESPSYERFCSCLIAQLQKNVSLYDFIELSNSETSANEDRRFLEATGNCMPDFPPEALKDQSAQRPPAYRRHQPDMGVDDHPPLNNFAHPVPPKAPTPPSPPVVESSKTEMKPAVQPTFKPSPTPYVPPKPVLTPEQKPQNVLKAPRPPESLDSEPMKQPGSEDEPLEMTPTPSHFQSPLIPALPESVPDGTVKMSPEPAVKPVPKAPLDQDENDDSKDDEEKSDEAPKMVPVKPKKATTEPRELTSTPRRSRP